MFNWSFPLIWGWDESFEFGAIASFIFWYVWLTKRCNAGGLTREEAASQEQDLRPQRGQADAHEGRGWYEGFPLVPASSLRAAVLAGVQWPDLHDNNHLGYLVAVVVMIGIVVTFRYRGVSLGIVGCCCSARLGLRTNLLIKLPQIRLITMQPPCCLYGWYHHRNLGSNWWALYGGWSSTAIEASAQIALTWCLPLRQITFSY